MAFDLSRHGGPDFVECEECHEELYGDEYVFICEGRALCAACYAEEVGCDESDAKATAMEDVCVEIRTAEQYLDDIYMSVCCDAAYDNWRNGD